MDEKLEHDTETRSLDVNLEGGSWPKIDVACVSRLGSGLESTVHPTERENGKGDSKKCNWGLLGDFVLGYVFGFFFGYVRFQFKSKSIVSVLPSSWNTSNAL